MKTRIEKYLPLIIIFTILFVFILFLAFFYRYSISKNITEWGSFGSYFGGILSPILSFVLIYIVILQSIESRKNFIESKQLQIFSQKQINEQIEILKPKPELVYYLSGSGSQVHAVIENIGNATAYDINVSFIFTEEYRVIIDDAFERLSHFNYFPPKYKSGVFVSHININRNVIGLPPHKVSIRYKKTLYENNFEICEYEVDRNMLDTLYSENNISQRLTDISRSIEKIKKCGK